MLWKTTVTSLTICLLWCGGDIKQGDAVPAPASATALTVLDPEFILYTMNYCCVMTGIIETKILLYILEKFSAFSSSCGGLQPSTAPVGPIGPNNRALRTHLKMFKIHLENFAVINLEIFAEICLFFFAEIHLKKFAEIYLEIFAKSI